MRLLIRVDGDGRIGGGHVMRCLTLAEGARALGHHVHFVMVDAPDTMAGRVRAAGYELTALPEIAHNPAEAPAHAGWLRLPPDEDARLSATAAQTVSPDWIVLDHYGLDADWVATLRDAHPQARVLAIDDLDDRALAADLLLDQARLDPEPYRHPPLATLRGPAYALLRPEFAELREAALARRDGAITRVLIAPGMMDAAGLAPMCLRLLAAEFPDLQAEVVMGSTSQSVEATRALVAAHPQFSLTLDAGDMAARMAQADLCIGAGGMTSWERCCLGLPTLAVAVADNQRKGVAQLAARGAVVPLSLEEARDQKTLAAALRQAIGSAAPQSHAATTICDGTGRDRVLGALSGAFRPLRADDATRLFEWRNQPRIRAISLTQDPLVWETHEAWVARTAARQDGLWRIYSENGCDIGFAGASIDSDGVARWSFYIGAEDAPEGAGGRMMAAFLRGLAERPDVKSIRAEVLSENAASVRLHERLGFARDPAQSTPAVLAFTRDPWDVRARLRLPTPPDSALRKD
ncbi:UDP-2,4-diacetamido-2,4,6-trideoxy-beta-L-altropyranose hydrolase [Pseudothioclava nitratireducens]|uniref:UDP-2,4-diacetamido-2,4, 6-trideoxy-beta-L-altropyranose hydrolase n=1 Tax=Pseudothioclava nitratireducens TaxID=1928646 RepID=UPI0023DC4947|nr:UDP-2,4-diacetamido-2,4,6-trideoxy-beta-L-altropyranose hydrolase [Defluviimonas nitratireducens]MDF1619265.1 UDP-2,4-diacetamido-2,4,6-trideoxy-beta-L-altropyranose hydrolase [Defluviimonas nitratireducens]